MRWQQDYKNNDNLFLKFFKFNIHFVSNDKTYKLKKIFVLKSLLSYNQFLK